MPTRKLNRNLNIAQLILWIFEKYKNSENHLGELIMAKGFEWFRKTEFNELQRIWKGDDSWVALGGGSLTQAVTGLIESSDRIKGYWLNTNFELCFERIQNSKERPLANMDKDQLEALYLDRVKSYSNYDEKLNF